MPVSMEAIMTVDIVGKPTTWYSWKVCDKVKPF